MRNEDERSDICRSHTVLLFDFRRVLVLLWRDCATPPSRNVCRSNGVLRLRSDVRLQHVMMMEDVHLSAAQSSGKVAQHAHGGCRVAFHVATTAVACTCTDRIVVMYSMLTCLADIVGS